VDEARKRLPYPTNTQQTRYTVAASFGRVMPHGFDCRCVNSEVYREITFELRGEIDDYGDRVLRWMYSGGVRV
jgi:hypothetical protein